MRVPRDPLFYFRRVSGPVAAIAARPERHTQDRSVPADNWHGPAHRHPADTESLTTMVVLIGYAVAMGCIFGAYIIHGGNIGVILHALPTELMAILGGSLGAFAVNNQSFMVTATT